MVDDVRGRTVLLFQSLGAGAVDRLHLDFEEEYGYFLSGYLIFTFTDFLP